MGAFFVGMLIGVIIGMPMGYVLCALVVKFYGKTKTK